jgi:hypothetical protein
VNDYLFTVDRLMELAADCIKKGRKNEREKVKDKETLFVRS